MTFKIICRYVRKEDMEEIHATQFIRNCVNDTIFTIYTVLLNGKLLDKMDACPDKHSLFHKQRTPLYQ